MVLPGIFLRTNIFFLGNSTTFSSLQVLAQDRNRLWISHDMPFPVMDIFAHGNAEVIILAVES
jgi:hypothetical protein